MFRHYDKLSRIAVIVLLFSVLVSVAYAQDEAAPAVEVTDQIITDRVVTVPRVVAGDTGWLVIHADSGDGSPGEVIGFTPVMAGENLDVTVSINMEVMTPTLYAMLHTDDSDVGAYEFGTVEGADAPVTVDGEVVVEPFNIYRLLVPDQLAANDVVTVTSVTMPAPGWVVIHAGDVEGFAEPIGHAFVEAGTTTNLAVEIDSEARTNILWPMLHVDTGAEGEYEFGTVEGADSPVVANDQVAVLPISTVPVIRAPETVALDVNGVITGDTAAVTLSSVLMDAPGYLVVHAEADGAPGPVIGFTPVAQGQTAPVTVEVDAAMLTPNLWPMLHEDTGTAGEYEFGTVEGADLPVQVDGSTVTLSVAVAPYMRYSDQPLAGNTVTIREVWIDGPGWIAVHADDGSNNPGPVIGHAAVAEGVNENVVVELDPEGVTDTVFPMLHRDTGAVGEYEFGTVEGADGPVRVGGRVVVGPLSLTEAEATPEPEAEATEEAEMTEEAGGS